MYHVKSGFGLPGPFLQPADPAADEVEGDGLDEDHGHEDSHHGESAQDPRVPRLVVLVELDGGEEAEHCDDTDEAEREQKVGSGVV